MDGSINPTSVNKSLPNTSVSSPGFLETLQLRLNRKMAKATQTPIESLKKQAKAAKELFPFEKDASASLANSSKISRFASRYL